MTPPGSETLTAYRTVHGIVFARGKVHGKKVAFVSARSTYGHEADSALFFRDLNDPKFMKGGVSSFRKAAKYMNFAFNWSYIDSKHTAYQLTGWYPQRAKGTSPDFPILGTGQYDWKGFNPKTHEASWRPAGARAARGRPSLYMVSWNNKQAPGWSAADDQYGFGPIYRQQMIAGRIRHDLRGGRKMTLPQLVQAMDEPATEDIRAVKLLPILLRAMGKPGGGPLKSAVAELRAWRRAGSHRRDLNKDGHDEFTPAITLMDAWWPRLVAAEFQPALGKKLYQQTQGMIGLGGAGRPGARLPVVLRRLVRIRVEGPAGRQGGTRGRPTAAATAAAARSRSAARRSASPLLAAAKVTPQQEYGLGDCPPTPTPPAGTRTAQRTPRGSDPGAHLPEPADLPAGGLRDARRQVARQRTQRPRTTTLRGLGLCALRGGARERRAELDRRSEVLDRAAAAADQMVVRLGARVVERRPWPVATLRTRPASSRASRPA